MIKPTLVLTYEFKASPQRVFDVLTQAEHLNRWYTKNAHVDLQVGGKISNADGDQGKFIRVAVPRELVYTYTHEKLGVETEVDITFTSGGPLNWTRVRIVQKGLDAEKVSAEAYEWMNSRWNWMAENLKRYLEKRSQVTYDTWSRKRQPVYATRD